MADILSGLSAGTLTLVGAAFAAGLARGFAGFGAALIFVPLASAVVGPRMAATVLFVIDIVGTAPLIPNAFRTAHRRDVLVMAAGAVVTGPLGAYALIHGDATNVRWALSAIVVATLILLISGWRYHGRPRVPLSVGVGAASGFLSGFAQMGGPPVIAYWLGSPHPAAYVRANIILFFAATDVISGIAYAVGGSFTRHVLLDSLIAGPAYVAGVWLGSHLFGRADETLFRRACYGLIALAAVLGLPLWDRLR